MKLLKLVPDNTNIDFMGWRNVALVISILVTIASLEVVGVRGLNLGVDFVGGQMIRTTFAQPIDVDELQVDLNIVAAFLAIVGYSLNDTVVIYDRIRENLRKYRKMAIIPLLNLSLNETLSRTIVTALSIMLALAMLLFFGPDVIFGLTAAILLGTFIGTYSSIYISAPMLTWLGLKPDSFLVVDEKGQPEPQEA